MFTAKRLLSPVTIEVFIEVKPIQEGYEKPHPKMFEAALMRARQLCNLEELQPHQILHIGDNLEKVQCNKCSNIEKKEWFQDYYGAKAHGFESVLMDRYSNLDAKIVKEHEVPVVQDFLDVVEFVTLKSREND